MTTPQPITYLHTKRCKPMSPNRYGEPDNEPDEAPHECNNGWLDRDADHPSPCLVCKPHLAAAVRRAQRARQVAVPGEPVDWSGRRARRGDT